MTHSTRSGITCPFSGQEFVVFEAGTGFFARAAGYFGAVQTSIFESRDALLAFLSRRAEREWERPRAPLAHPTCPFTGRSIEKRKTTGGWRAICRTDTGCWSTGLFYDERRLDFFLASRNGVPPFFARNELEVVGERKPPAPDPLADVKTKHGDLCEAAKEAVDRVVRGSRAVLDGVAAPRKRS